MFWCVPPGDIVHVEALRNNLVVLNSLAVITELLDDRRAIYSDRPEFLMAGDLMGAQDTITFIQCNEKWKTYRKFTRHALNKQAAVSFRGLQRHATELYLQSLLRVPQSFIPELRL
jgi:hypothetical protein